MEQIYPLREEVLATYGGMPVAVIFKSGYRQIGIVRSCQGGKLVLGNPYSSRPAYYGRGLNQGGTYTAEADEASQPIESKPAAAVKRQGKKKKSKVAGVSQSPTKYASDSDNPSLSARGEEPGDMLKVNLDDIAFVFLIV